MGAQIVALVFAGDLHTPGSKAIKNLARGEGLSGVFDMLIEVAGEPFRVPVAAERRLRYAI